MRGTWCLSLCIHLADALDYLHRQQLIHRDIKPSNIIFVKRTPKFADVGLVTGIATEDHETTYLGTEGYIAPEGPGTPAADIYGLGKVLYEATTGQDRRESGPLAGKRHPSPSLPPGRATALPDCRRDAGGSAPGAGTASSRVQAVDGRGAGRPADLMDAGSCPPTDYCSIRTTR